MKKARRSVIFALLFTLAAASLPASLAASARRRDPLTEAEADQLRQAALEPNKRMKLYIKFADARLVSIEQMRADPKQSEGRGHKVHDLLEDFTAILDEINDNLDTYQGRPLSKDDRKDFKRGLSDVLSACAQWDLRFTAMKLAMETDPQTKKEAEDYKFVFLDATEALKSSADMAREYIETTPIEKPATKK